LRYLRRLTSHSFCPINPRRSLLRLRYFTKFSFLVPPSSTWARTPLIWDWRRRKRSEEERKDPSPLAWRERRGENIISYCLGHECMGVWATHGETFSWLSTMSSGAKETELPLRSRT
jgi:hypothetical protein